MMFRESQPTRVKKTGWVEGLAQCMVAAMALLQLYFALSAYFDPTAFSVSRGTPLLDNGDGDWVQIYASRTLFIALFLGVLLLRREYSLLARAASLGTVMPVTDGMREFPGVSLLTVSKGPTVIRLKAVWRQRAEGNHEAVF